MNIASRRNFLVKLGAVSSLSFLSNLSKGNNQIDSIISAKAEKSEDELVTDESFWYQIKMAFSVSPAANTPLKAYKVDRSQKVLSPERLASPSGVHSLGENKASMVPAFRSKIPMVSGMQIQARKASFSL